MRSCSTASQQKVGGLQMDAYQRTISRFAGMDGRQLDSKTLDRAFPCKANPCTNEPNQKRKEAPSAVFRLKIPEQKQKVRK